MLGHQLVLLVGNSIVFQEIPKDALEADHNYWSIFDQSSSFEKVAIRSLIKLRCLGVELEVNQGCFLLDVLLDLDDLVVLGGMNLFSHIVS